MEKENEEEKEEEEESVSFPFHLRDICPPAKMVRSFRDQMPWNSLEQNKTKVIKTKE